MITLNSPHTPIPPFSDATGNIVPLPVPILSFFDTCTSTKPSQHITISDLLEGVRDGRWRVQVEDCRHALEIEDKAAYDRKRKATVPAVTLSARLDHRNAGALEDKGAVHSGFLQLDFDAKDHKSMTVAQIRDIVEQAPFVAACFLSLSGIGVKAIAHCPPNFETHLGSWLAAEAYFRERGLTLDHATKEPTRLCFVSHDQQALIRDGAEEIVPLEVPEKCSDEGASGGTEDPEHVDRTLAKLATQIGPYQNRATWIHICACVKDAVGATEAGELVDAHFPPQPHHESASDVMKSLTGTWLSLRKYGIDPVDYIKLMPDLSECEDDTKQTKPTRKRLSDYLVNHSETLFMPWTDIEALRPPFIIDGFLRRGEVLLLGAESKSRKSWLLIRPQNTSVILISC